MILNLTDDQAAVVRMVLNAATGGDGPELIEPDVRRAVEVLTAIDTAPSWPDGYTFVIAGESDLAEMMLSQIAARGYVIEVGGVAYKAVETIGSHGLSCLVYSYEIDDVPTGAVPVDFAGDELDVVVIW